MQTQSLTETVPAAGDAVGEEILRVFRCQFDEEAGKLYVDAEVVGRKSNNYP
jgi:hypothetical protein